MLTGLREILQLAFKNHIFLSDLLLIISKNEYQKERIIQTVKDFFLDNYVFTWVFSSFDAKEIRD